MADFEKKVTLIEVEIDNKSAIANVDKLSGAILDQKKVAKDNNDQIKELNKTNTDLSKQVKAGTITQEEANKQSKKNSQQAEELSKKNLNLQDGIKDLNKERTQAVKVSKLQANSLDALRNKVVQQKKELNGLNTATEKGAKRFDELTKELEENNKAIVKADQAAGDYKTSIGDYAGQLSIVQKATAIQTQAQGFLNAVVNTGTKSTGFASKALRIFKIALASTGVGLLVIALGSLVSFLTSTQEGMDKVTAVTRPLFAVFEKMKGVVQDLGGNVFAGLAQIINGDIREGLKTLGSGFKDAFTDVKTAVSEGIEAGTELDKLTKQIEKSEIALTTQRATLNKVFAESQEIAKDITKTEKERIAAANAAIQAQNDLLGAEQNFLDLKIQRLELEQTLNDTSREGELELAGLIAERTNFEEAASKKRAAASAQLNAIKKQVAGEELGRIKTLQDADDKARDEKIKKDEEAAKKQVEQKIALDAKLLELETFRREQENEAALEAAESDAERFELELEQQTERFDIEQELLAEQREIALENELLSNEEKLTLQADFDLQQEEMAATNEDALATIDKDAKKEAADRKKKADSEEVKAEQKKRKTISALINQGLNTIKGLSDSFFAAKNNKIASENTKETNELIKQLNSGQITRAEFDQKKVKLERDTAIKAYNIQRRQFIANKAIALVETGVNTAKGVMGAVASIPGPVGIALGVLVGLLGVAQGVAIATKQPPSPPSFAQGGDVFGFTVGGKSHAQGGTKYRGEDGNAFEVEKDEGIFVTKRNATNPALSMLSSINESHGGRSMFSNPKTFLQEGGQAQNQGVSSGEISDIVSATVANMPPSVVKVTDIMGGVNANVEAEETGVV